MAENGDIGLIDGKMGMGAPVFDVGPFVQVALLFAKGRSLLAGDGSEGMLLLTVLACISDGRGDNFAGLVA